MSPAREPKIVEWHGKRYAANENELGILVIPADAQPIEPVERDEAKEEQNG